MGKRRKFIDKILSGQSDTNIPFDRTRNLLLYLGFQETIKGTSHYKFRRNDIEELISLQEKEGKCKPYQVEQLREVLEEYNIRSEL